MATILRSIMQALISMGMALLTETFLKDLIVLGLEKIVKRTKNTVDDRILNSIRRAWGMPAKTDEEVERGS